MARKILCPSYMPSEISSDERFKLIMLHGFTMVRVIRRHLKMGYELKDIERRGPSFRMDLVFESPSGKTRIVEVKSAKKIKQVDRMQAALYPHSSENEVVVSNGQTDEILDPAFIEDVRCRAEYTIRLLTKNPGVALNTFTPNDDTCYTCGNNRCPFYSYTKRIGSFWS